MAKELYCLKIFNIHLLSWKNNSHEIFSGTSYNSMQVGFLISACYSSLFQYVFLIFQFELFAYCEK